MQAFQLLFTLFILGVVFCQAALFKKKDDGEEEIGTLNAKLGLHHLTNTEFSPELMAELMDMARDPDIMKEVQAMMEDPHFQEEMKKLAPNMEKAHEMAEEMMKDPEMVRAATAQIEAGMAQTKEAYAELQGQKAAASINAGLQAAAGAFSDPSNMAQAFEMLKDPAIQKEVEAMMANPAFKAQMEQMVTNPGFTEAAAKMQAQMGELMKDPNAMKEAMDMAQKMMGAQQKVEL